MLDYFLNKGWTQWVVFFEHFEVLAFSLSSLILFKVGRVGLSLGIFALVHQAKVIIDYFAFILVTTIESQYILELHYNVFVTTCFLELLLTSLVHKRFKVEPSLFTIICCTINFTNLTLIATRYIDMRFLENFDLGNLYKIGVPVMNMAIVLTFILGVAFCLKRSKSFPHRIPWRLNDKLD